MRNVWSYMERKGWLSSPVELSQNNIKQHWIITTQLKESVHMLDTGNLLSRPSIEINTISVYERKDTQKNSTLESPKLNGLKHWFVTLLYFSFYYVIRCSILQMLNWTWRVHYFMGDAFIDIEKYLHYYKAKVFTQEKS